MNDLLTLIHRHGGTVELRTDTTDYGPCTEHPDHPVPPAVAEVTSVDCPELHPCAACLPAAIERAQIAAEDAWDHNPRITVTVTRPATELARAA